MPPELASAALTADPAVAGFEAQKLDIPKIETSREYDLLPQGQDYVDPEGKKRLKPWTVTSAADYENVPEGVEYRDPTGTTRLKPRYQGIGFTAQTLYDMAVTDKERSNILEKWYPGKVKKAEGGEFYVDDDGTLRKPGRGVERVLGFGAAAAAPTGLGALGALGGGATGTLAGPVGTVAGTVAGGFSGSVLGQSFNDLILQLAGVYDRTATEEFVNLGTAGLMGSAGAGVGRGAATIVRGVGGLSAVGAALPQLGAKFVGAEAEGLRTARSLADKGVLPPPSGWAKEAPHIQNIVEVFDPAFHTQEPLLQSATEHYESGAQSILRDLGVEKPGPVVKPTAAPSTEEAGVKLLAKAREESTAADVKLREALEARKTALAVGTAEKKAAHEATVESLRAAEREARDKAQGLIDAGFADIQTDVNQAMAATKAGHNSGDLWWQVGEKLKAVKQGIAARAAKMYDHADALAGEHRPDISGLPERAKAFLEQLPEGFEGKYPTIVRQLRDMAGVEELDKAGNPTGKWVKEPVQPTFGQLHNLRSILRSNYNSLDLTPDIKQGTFKFFAHKVDDILHDPGATPELQEAARALREADNFYRDAMGPLTDRHIQAVMNGLESGMPADPKVLFSTLVKEGRSDLTAKVREMVGSNLWAGVKAADVQEMLDASKTLIPGQINGRVFAKQVLERHRGNMLEAVHGREASAKLLKQAQDIEMLDGRLDVSARPNDTISDVIRKTHEAAQAAKEAAKLDPLGSLTREMRGIEKEHRATVGKLRAERKSDPLGFLYDPSTLATQAVDKILNSEDLILAAAAKFGEESPEFNLMRQLWVQRVLENTMRPGERLSKVSEEVQRLMFPGVTLKQMQTLAKEMDFLLDTRRAAKGTAQGMSAMAKVEHPWSHILGGGGVVGKILAAPTKVIPGSDAAGRYILGTYYGWIRKLATSPATLRWFERGLSGTPEEKAAVRAVISRTLQKGGAAGAAVGEALEQKGTQ